MLRQLRPGLSRLCIRCQGAVMSAWADADACDTSFRRTCSSTSTTAGKEREGPALVIPMPKMSHEMESGTIGKWLKREGDKVAKYDLLLEVSTDTLVEDAYKTGDFEGSVTLLIENNEDDGVLAKILVPEGQQVPVGKPIGLFVEEEAGDVQAAVRAAKEWKVPTHNVYDESGAQPRVRVLEWQSYLKESKKEKQGGCM